MNFIWHDQIFKGTLETLNYNFEGFTNIYKKYDGSFDLKFENDCNFYFKDGSVMFSVFKNGKCLNFTKFINGEIALQYDSENLIGYDSEFLSINLKQKQIYFEGTCLLRKHNLNLIGLFEVDLIEAKIRFFKGKAEIRD